MKTSLLDDDEGADGAPVELHINPEYARRFEHNAKRADLHRLMELEKAGKVSRDVNYEDDSPSEDEDEDGSFPPVVDAKIFDTLTRIKRRDPSIYQADVKFFEDIGEGEVGTMKVKREKPIYLKDYVARSLQQDEEAEEEEEEEENMEPTYVEEQADLKKSLLAAAGSAQTSQCTHHRTVQTMHGFATLIFSESAKSVERD